MKALVLSLTLFAVAGTALAQTPTAKPTPPPPPDFSYIWVQPAAKDSKESVQKPTPVNDEIKLGEGITACELYSVPEEVQKGYSRALVKEWKYAADYFDRLSKTEQDSFSEDFKEQLAIYKIDRNKFVMSSDVYVLRVFHEISGWISSCYYLLTYNPQTKVVKNKPIYQLCGGSTVFLGTEDLLGDGNTELKFEESSHNGTQQFRDVYFFAIQPDSTLKEVFTYSADPFDKTFKFDSRDPKWKEAVKNFDPSKYQGITLEE